MLESLGMVRRVLYCSMQWLFLAIHSVPMVCENVYEPFYNTRITWVALCDKLREVAEEFAENSSKEE